MKKICKRCNTEKDVSLFVKQKTRSGGIKYANCKSCTSEYLKEYKSKNKDRISKVNKEWAEKNKSRLTSWRKNNRDSINASWRKMYHKDDLSRLKQRLRSATRRYVNKNQSISTVDVIGCDYDQLLVHLLLTLDKKDRIKYINQKDDFHIDHIIPISWAKDEESVLELSKYQNLRLCEKEENWRKGNRWS
jgi:transcription elongation factor Elf1